MATYIACRSCLREHAQTHETTHAFACSSPSSVKASLTFFAIRRLKKEDSETSKFKLSVLVPKEPKAASEEQADFHMHFTCTFLLQSKAIQGHVGMTPDAQARTDNQSVAMFVIQHKIIRDLPWLFPRQLGFHSSSGEGSQECHTCGCAWSHGQCQNRTNVSDAMKKTW